MCPAAGDQLDLATAMFVSDDSCCVGMQPPFAAQLAGDSPLTRLAGRLLQDEMMDVMMEPHLVFGPSRVWARPRPRCCPYTCVMTRPRRPMRQHLVILPRLADDAAASGDRPCDRGEPARCCHTTDKGEASPHSRRRTASTSSVNSEGWVASNNNNSSSNRKQAASACSGSREGCAASRKQADSPCSVSRHSPPDEALHCRGKTCSPTDSEEAPWQFSVDVKGCDEVRATTERGMLVVEGRGSSDTSQQMVRYVTSLPRHVTHDSLTASLANDGRLTVTQHKAAPQLLPAHQQARTLPIDLQPQASPEPEQQQQQQQDQQHHASAESQQQEQQKASPEP